MDIIRRLENIGFHFNLRLAFEYTARNDPPPEAAPLLAELAARKSEAVRYLAEKPTHTITSERFKSAIAKGISSGENPYKLLLDAIECISLITGDKQFNDANRAAVLAVHGVGLEQPQALELDLAETLRRLGMLTRTELNNESADVRARITWAIKAHRERERRLLAAMGHTA